MAYPDGVIEKESIEKRYFRCGNCDLCWSSYLPVRDLLCLKCGRVLDLHEEWCGGEHGKGLKGREEE